MKKSLFCLAILSMLATAGVEAQTPRRLAVEKNGRIESNMLERTVSGASADISVRSVSRGMKNAVMATSSEPKVIVKAPMPDPTLKFWGLVGYSDHNEAGTMNAHRGFYEIDGVGNFTKLDEFPISSSPSAPCAYTGDGRVIMQGNGTLYRVFSTSTWSDIESLTTPSRAYYLFSTTWDPYTGSLLACATNLSANSSTHPYQLVTIDPTTMRREVILDLEVPLYAIALNPEGTIYALDQNFNFKTIGRDGKVTEIKKTVVPFTLDKAFGGGSMTWDPVSNRLLTGIRGVTDEPMASAEPFPGCLYEINPATGDAQMIVQFTYNDELCGIAFPDGIYDPGAPAKATGLTTTFNAGSVDGKVTFTAPSNTVNGNDLSGSLTYWILIDGVEIATGSVEPSATAEVDVKAPASGEQAVSVQLGNEAGRGCPVSTTVFIGTDVPAAPASVSASYSSSGLMFVSWTKVTASANGGYINPDDVTYTVTRYNLTDADEEPVVCTTTKLTTWAEGMAEPDKLTDYRFGVSATYDEKTSPETQSNTVRAGSYVAPYSYDFPDSDEFKSIFTSINYNTESSGGHWEYSYDGWGTTKNGYARCRRGYGASGDVDKWLLTPGFRFEKDKVYRFDIDVKSYGNSYNEQIEVLVGTDPNNPEMWDKYVIEPTDFAGTTWRTLTGYINVPSNNKYYIGIHGCTPSSRSHYYIFVDNIRVGQAVSATAPGSVSNLSAVAGPIGTHYCDVSFNSPTKNFMETENLSSLTAIKVYRNGELIKTFSSPALGSTFSFKDEEMAPGAYKYSVVTENADGVGPEMSAEVYVGVPLPARPSNVKFVESETNPGEVTITWDAVTTDVNGAAIPAGYVSYAVVDLVGNRQVWLADVQTNSYTYQAVAPGEKQQFKTYAIFAETESGTGYGLASLTKPVGTSCQLPVVESFANAGVTIPLALSSAAWGTLRDGDIENGPTAVDGDNGYACMIASYADETSDLITGKIDLTQAKNPYLTFWTYNILPANGTPDLNEFRVIVECNGEEFAPKSFAIAQECRLEGWNRVLVDLKKYAGKTVQITLRAKAVNYQFTILDDMRVYDAPDHDLVVKEFATPDDVKAEKDFRIRVVLDNYGATTENDYTINIYRDGEKVISAPGKTVSPSQTVFADFNEMMTTMVEPGEHKYHAEIELSGDANPADNKSYETTINLRHPKYPAVEELAGEQAGADVALTWQKPTIVRTPDIVIEDFEKYDCLTQDLDEWTLLDEDELAVYGFDNFTMPGIVRGAPQSWMLVDNSQPEYQGYDAFAARSGDKCLMQMIPDEGIGDDWLISPALFGDKQDIDFYIRNFYQNDRCEFEFLYTTQDAAPVWGFQPYQFTSIGRMYVTSENWSHFTFEVPYGTKHFAIRANSYSGVILMLDDLRYRPLDNADLTLLGYNIYHNGEKLTDTPVKSTGYTHLAPAVEADHNYAVTAVYDKGESAPMKIAVAMSGLDAVLSNGVTVSVDGHNIVVDNAVGNLVSVASADGRSIYTGAGVLRNVIPVATTGIYLVRVGTTTYKVIVR